MSESFGSVKVLGIALKTAVNGPMQEVDHAVGVIDAGLECPVRPSADRGVTFLSAQQWDEINSELGAELPWHTRRANVLLDAGCLRDLLGKTVRVGELVIDIKGETHPCGLMDTLHQGLKAALGPDCRGGVYGRITQGGALRVGDVLSVQ